MYWTGEKHEISSEYYPADTCRWIFCIFTVEFLHVTSQLKDSLQVVVSLTSVNEGK